MIPPGALARVRLFAAALWVGGLWTVALAAATLSAVIADRAVFGQIVSGLFFKVALVALACGLVTLLLAGRDGTLEAKRRRTIRILAVCMLLCVGVYFALQPMMAALREAAGPGGVMASDVRRQFGMLHGVTFGAYGIQAVLGIVLLIKSLPRKAR